MYKKRFDKKNATKYYPFYCPEQILKEECKSIKNEQLVNLNIPPYLTLNFNNKLRIAFYIDIYDEERGIYLYYDYVNNLYTFYIHQEIEDKYNVMKFFYDE